MRGVIFLTVYADILFVINFFLTYLLLLLTAKISKAPCKSARLLFASFLGGAYSLVIFIDRLNILLSWAGKLLSSALIILAAFGFIRLTLWLKRLLIFWFSSLLFLGVIAGLQLLFKSNAVRLYGGAVYFDISAAALILSALFAYLVSALVIWIYNRTASKNEIYLLKIFKGEDEFALYAFADSGNRLHEPFSGFPVIIVDKEKITLEGDRIIPYNTVGGDGMLKAFRPDRVVISAKGKSVETDRVYIALSVVNEKDFSAILNTELLRGAL